LILGLSAVGVVRAATAVEFGPLIGAVSPSTAEVRVCVDPASGPWSAIFRPYRGENGAIVSVPGERMHPDSPIVAFRATGLSPDTPYTCSVVEGDGRQGVAATGSFRTFPSTAATFRFAFGSCARTGSDHEVFAAIRAAAPLFFLNTGDLHYENIAENAAERFFAAYRRVFTAPRQAALYAATPLVYMWDDHDYGPNDADRTAPGRTAARLAYREVIPHYPMIFGEGDRPIAQAFSVGRARFILTDLRSERSPSDLRDGPQKTMLGEHQKEWFKRELLAARQTHAVIFWVSSVTWIGKPGNGVDHWGAYATERAELARFFADHDIDNLIILAGDAHMLAADDGSNTRYLDGPGAAPLAVFQAAALDNNASYKGGPFSHGAYLPKAGEGCYGLVTVEDDGEHIRVIFSGRNHRQEEKIHLEVDLP